MDKRIFLVLGLMMISFWSFGQKIVPHGEFYKDSVKIGEPIHYSLMVKYPMDWQVIYPDSTFNYAPFEFYSKKYFPTNMDSIYAIDSVVYELATFEIDLVQKLAVPIFVLNRGDSLEVMPEADSVFLQELVQQVPDTVRLKANFNYLPVHYAVNYPYLMIGGVIFIIICVIIFFAFGNKIRARIKLYRLRKEFEKFSLNFERGITNIRNNEHNASLIEEILVIWKKYMEKLENKPFTKYTSKEILKAGYEKELGEVLQNIDRAIYGKMSDDFMHKNFESLEDLTLQYYQLKVKEVNNG